MGTNLILETQGKQLLDLGRLHNFEVNEMEIENFKDLNNFAEYIYAQILEKIIPFLGYTPKNKKELDKIVSDIKGHISDYAEDCEKIGRISVLLNLKDEGLEIRKDF